MTLGEAVHATVEARTARIAWGLRTGAPLGAIRSRFLDSAGIVDLARRRAALANRSAPRGATDPAGFDEIHDGPRVFTWVPRQEAWRLDPTRAGGGTGPLWLLGALPAAEELVELGRADHRGDPVVRLGGRIDAPVGLPPALEPLRGLRSPGSQQPRTEVEVWLDDAGRIRVLSSRELPLPSGGLAGQFVARLFGSVGASEGEAPVWATTELWDFGIPLTIAVPG